MPAAFSSAFSTVTRSWVVLIASQVKYRQTIPDGQFDASHLRWIDPRSGLDEDSPIATPRTGPPHEPPRRPPRHPRLEAPSLGVLRPRGDPLRHRPRLPAGRGPAPRVH